MEGQFRQAAVSPAGLSVPGGMRMLVGSLTLCAVLFGQKAALSARESPLPAMWGRPSLTQRDNGTPNCEGLVEESGDRDRLPPWAMGWLMPKGNFVSVFRFNTRKQAESCAAGTEFTIRRWDRESGTWKSS